MPDRFAPGAAIESPVGLDASTASGDPTSDFNLGNALQAAGDATGAIPRFRRTLATIPSFGGAWNNLGVAFSARGRLPAAFAALRRAVSADPRGTQGWNNLGNALLQAADADGAVAAYRQALRIDPAHRIAQANLINALRLVDGATAGEELAECRQFSLRHEAPLNALAPARPREPGRRLRIGYVGADAFRYHTAAVSLLPLIEAHDREMFETVCYSDVPPGAEDDVTSRFAAASRLVSTLGLSDEALAARIRADDVDIAVDVIGYPRGSRLLALARRPAPVQVNLLLMGTFGLDAVGWAISDDHLTPAGADRHFTERLARIDLAFAYDALRPTPKVDELPALHGRPVTFGCFNQPVKLSSRCIATWARLLDRVPGARLMLKGRAYNDATVAGRIKTAFARHGVDGRRIELRGWTVTSANHLETYRKVDIALDPFPYGGVITTCEAMWMGVPVIALEGERVLGRYGSAFLKTVGLPELVATDEDGYVDLAAGLAGDTARLSALRSSLRQRMAASRLCDGAAFARQVEAAYRSMWRSWCAG
jgi:protein O-GlcNAc transferase